MIRLIQSTTVFVSMIAPFPIHMAASVVAARRTSASEGAKVSLHGKQHTIAKAMAHSHPMERLESWRSEQNPEMFDG